MEKLGGKEPEEVFRDIFDRCRALGISPRELSSLQVLKSGKTKGRICFQFGAVFILIYAFSIPFGMGAFARYLVRFWLNGDMCLFDMPPEVQNLFMPPVDCSLCRNLTEVERVADIGQREFEHRFAYSGVPVIVKDGTKNWTAPHVFSFEFFRDIYSSRDTSSECQFFPYKTEFQSLHEALSMSPERVREPWYVGWSNCDGGVGSVLREHYRKPYFLPPHAECTNVDWIFMGTPGHGAHMHIDHVDHPSWQAQIKGSKLWTLEPVPECYNECRTIEALVEAGEVIVLDTNRWYHKTLIVGDTVSITIGSEYD